MAAAPALAHHGLDSGAQPTVINGLISGLFHPVLGPDHLLFLLALSLVGLRHRAGWMLGLLVVGLLGSCAGLLLPGLPGAETMAALSLALVALLLLGRLPRGLLLPAFALHGYVLSASVLGWSAMPIASYLIGLVISQGLLLLLSLALLARLCRGVGSSLRRSLALALAGVGGVLALAPLLA
ncbi:MAG: HupE/UreJ family protein [Synechococcaceae cyanobacterium]|nr:HupE/UreJ family protein [Synechococcaceae cyanobacterium]